MSMMTQNFTFKAEADVSEIPSDFVQWNTPHCSMSDQVVEGSYLRLQGGDLYSPSLFYLNLVETFNQLEALMKRLQLSMESKMKSQQWVRDMTPHHCNLVPGLYVLAKYQKEWHRGKILNKVSENKFDVLMIDFGSKATVDIQDITYMLKAILNEMPAQAIQCSLQFDGYLPEPGHKWQKRAVNNFLAILADKVVGVRFNDRITIGESPLQENIWLVSIDTMKGCASSYCRPDFRSPAPIRPSVGQSGDFRPSERLVTTVEHYEYIREVEEENISRHFVNFLKNPKYGTENMDE